MSKTDKTSASAKGARSIKYTCVHCSEEIEALYSDIGTEKNCPACGGLSRVPLPRVKLSRRNASGSSARKGEAIFERKQEPTKPQAPIEPSVVAPPIAKTVSSDPKQEADPTMAGNATGTRTTEGSEKGAPPIVDEPRHPGANAPHGNAWGGGQKSTSSWHEDVRLRTAAGLVFGLFLGVLAHSTAGAIDFSGGSRVTSSTAGVSTIAISSRDEAQIRWELIQRRVAAAKRTADEIKSMEATLSDPSLSEMPDFRIGVENRITELNMEVRTDYAAVRQAVGELVDYSKSRNGDYQQVVDALILEAQQAAKYTTADRFASLNNIVQNSNNSNELDDESFASFWSSGIGLEGQFGTQGETQ